MSSITIAGKKYDIMDAKEYITLADSFVKNKIGSGNGEAKLYVGNESDDLFAFWEDFSHECIFLKKDFQKFLLDAQSEFQNPQQNYKRKNDMPEKFNVLTDRINELSKDVLRFQIYRVSVEPPRVYVNSNSDFYDLMRSVGLPNISYLSVLKLQDTVTQQIVFYFKLFIDYKSDFSLEYTEPEVAIEEEKIKTADKSEKQKARLLQARVGQGEYREKLLLECPFCPFTQVNDERLLNASHIKPWSKADDKEKVDPKNGFMFTPTYDRLFDRGFITFENNKELVVSPWLSPMNQKRLSIYTGKKIELLPLDEARMHYLEYHREHIFKK